MRPDPHRACTGRRARSICNVGITICKVDITRRSPARLLLAVLPVLALTSFDCLAPVRPQTLSAQENALIRDSLTALGPRIGKIPFQPGEEMVFRVRASVLGKGDAVMRVGQIDSIHGFPTFPLEFHIRGGAALGAFKIDKEYYSWLDTERLFSRRFHNITDHGRRVREMEFFPEERLVRRIDVDTTWALPSVLPLDDLSFVFFARTLPLEVGASYTYNRYFKDEGNPVILEVLRKDRVQTGVGEFNTIVVNPVIPGSNLFEQGARAEIHFSDDDRRLVVYMRVKYWVVPVTMELIEFTEGQSSGPAGKEP